MDDLKIKINEWVQLGNELLEYDEVIEDFFKDLEQQSFISELMVDKTPKQPKKKRNVLSTIINDSVNVDSNDCTKKVNERKLSLNNKSLDHITRQAEKDVSEQEQTNERPGRAAKDKAYANLKEPSLSSKMRYDNKTERISISNKSILNSVASLNLQLESIENNPDNSEFRMEFGTSKHSEQEIISEIRHSNNKKIKVSSRENMSIQIVIPAEIKIELLSDEERDKMPPPTQPPLKIKKKVKPASKSSNSTIVDNIISASEIKQEKSDSTSHKPSSSSQNNTRPKRTKGKKNRNTSESENSKSHELNLSDEIVPTNNISNENNIEKSDVSRKAEILNATFETVYEDAISDNAKRSEINDSNEQEVNECSVTLTQITASELESVKLSGIQVLNFENLNDVTCNMNVTRTVQPGNTFIVDKEQSNSTFVVPKINQKEENSQSSLLIDDESEPDKSNHQKSKKTDKNEIFNPLILSPVRKKVQAFEQHAAKNYALENHAETRATLVKSRVQDHKENTPVSRIPKPETPGRDTKPNRHLTPKEMSSSSIVILNLKKKYNSTSKLQDMGGGSGGLSSKSSTSRENSVEDLKRSASALQLAAEEKKRKREEKQKLTQHSREAKEREKRETTERIAREKQEKCKKLLQEREEQARQEYEKKKLLREHKLKKADLYRNLEEIKKNLQIATEQKREQSLLKMPKKHLANMKERDLLDVARMNAIRDDINRNLSYHIQETNRKSAKKQNPYDFDLLLSGDSTDEEDKPTTKKPQPPTWSLSKVRQPVIRQQNYLQWKMIDKLFSVQPMTIDLQEIFPTIDPRYLKRNSSVIWSTPPRYSELPKY